MGGNDAEVVLIGREAASGTRDGFESITGTKDKCQYRQELTSTGDVITAVSQNPDAIGYASLASIKDSVKALNVDSVTPSEATVKDGSYKVPWDNSVNKTVSIYADCSSSLVEQFPPSKAVEWADLM